MLVLCSNVTVSVKKCTCAGVRLEWSLDQLGRHIDIVIIIVIMITRGQRQRPRGPSATRRSGGERDQQCSGDHHGGRGFGEAACVGERVLLTAGSVQGAVGRRQAALLRSSARYAHLPPGWETIPL